MHLLFCLLTIIHLITSSNSQFICDPNTACVINCNSNNNNTDCSSQTIDASQATSLELNCDSMLCRAIKVFCPNSNTATCDINCYGNNACSGIGSDNPTIINSTLSSTLNVACTGSYSCSYMLTYGPISTANIDCNGEYACSSFGAWQFNQDYYLSHTNTIDITCNGTSSCRSSDYYVEYADTVNFKVTAAGTHAAENNKIYGSHITTKLSMTCQEYQGCLYVDLHCPISGTCILNSTSGTTSGSFDIFIQDESSDLLLFGNPQNGQGWTLHCDNGVTNTMLSIYDSNNAIYNYYCAYSTNGCCPHNLKVATRINCAQDEACVINCTNTEICRFKTIDGTLANSLTVNCDDGSYLGYACQASTIICPIGGDCNVNCYDEDCEYVTVKGDNINNFELQCATSRACQSSRISISNIVGNAYIFCGSSYSCQYSQFDISGINLNGNSNVYLNCSNGWGVCDEVTLTAINHNQVAVSCAGSSEQLCQDINIDASASDSLSLICDAVSGCENANVQCPFNQLHACSVECKDITESCFNLNIVVNDDYISDYLDLNCPSEPSNNPKCETIDFVCSQSNLQTDYTYDSTNKVYACSNDNCCPNNGGRTSDPTAPTTAMPTLAPITGAPTVAPITKTPTTQIPTSNPTLPTRSASPTISPTEVPISTPVIDVGSNSNHYKLSALFITLKILFGFCLYF